MGQGGPLPPMRDKSSISVSEYFLKDRGIDIPDEWLEDELFGSRTFKVLRLLEGPRWAIKTKYHDIFYEKYFEKYPQEK